MPKPSTQSFVIIERSIGSGDAIRTALINSGAKVHIFQSYSAALVLIGRKRIDGVVVEFDNDKATADFCAAVRRLNVPIVFSTPLVAKDDMRRFGFAVNFARRRETPTIFLPYRRPQAAGGKKSAPVY